MKNLLKIALIVFVIGVFTGCGCKHEYSEATCKKPATCNLCGAETGTTLEHNYSKATCKKPATCTLCGEENGKATGHSTDLGKCSDCGEVINYDVIMSIEEHLDNANYYSELATDQSKYSSTFVTAQHWDNCMSNMAEYYGKAKDELMKAYNLCGSYSALSGLKREIKDTADAAPVRWSGNASNKNDLTTYLEKCKTYIIMEGTCRLECLDIMDKMK